MEHVCRLSGLKLRKIKQFPGLVINDVHPIFKLPPEKILSEWATKQFTRSLCIEEQRLIFLATIHATGLVTQDAPADMGISHQALVNSYATTIYICKWIVDIAKPRGLRLPKLHISSMEGIGGVIGWLKAIDDIRNDNQFAAAEARRAEERKELNLTKDIRADEANLLTPQEKHLYVKRLARWAADSAGASKTKLVKLPKFTANEARQTTHWQFVYTLLITPTHKWQDLDKTSVDSVMNFLECNLPHISWAESHAILERCRKMQNAKSVELTLFELLDDAPVIVPLARAAKPGTLKLTKGMELDEVLMQLVLPVAKPVQPANILTAINSHNEASPKAMLEPVRADYASSLAYGLAKAKYKAGLAAQLAETEDN